jgi:hypothetical protein
VSLYFTYDWPESYSERVVTLRLYLEWTPDTPGPATESQLCQDSSYYPTTALSKGSHAEMLVHSDNLLL